MKYVNGGNLAGRAGDLARAYDWMIRESGQNDDQIALGIFANTFPDRIVMDIEHRVFLALAYSNHKKVAYSEDGLTVKYDNTFSSPALVHFMGFQYGELRDMALSKLAKYLRVRICFSKDILGKNIIGDDYIVQDTLPEKIAFSFQLMFYLGAFLFCLSIALSVALGLIVAKPRRSV